ncbi:MAG: hypothetical protein WCR27_05420, partial [Eubacteriales bacterium]
MNLLIYEYFASGAMKGHYDLEQAGFTMLDAVLKDFTQLPELVIYTILDSSLEKEIFLTSYVDKVKIDWYKGEINIFEQFEKILMNCDAVLIIAPEISGLIGKMTAIAEKNNKLVLG